MEQVAQSDQRDIPNHRRPCLVYKLEELSGNADNLGPARGIWHQSAGDDQLHCASVVFPFLLPPLLLFTIIVFYLLFNY